MRKHLAPAALAATLLALVIALAGCSSGPSDADIIRQGVSEELESIKSGDDDLIAQVEEGAGEDLEMLGLDTKEFMAAYLKGFDYKVGDVNVDGDSATVHVSITCRSMDGIEEDFKSAFAEALANVEDPSDTDSLYKIAGQAFLDSVNNAELKTVECDIPCEKDSDGNWSYADGVSEQIGMAIN